MSDVQRTPAVLPRRQFTDAERADITNRPARAEHWRIEREREDQARFQSIFDRLPADEQAEVRGRYLAGESLDDIGSSILHPEED